MIVTSLFNDMAGNIPFLTSINFSFLNHKTRNNIHPPGHCQNQLIKMYVRKPSIGLSKRSDVVCVFHRFQVLKGPPPTSTNAIYSSIFIHGGECGCSPMPLGHRKLILPCPLIWCPEDKRTRRGDFFGCPVVKNLPCKARDTFDPWSGN